MGKKKIRVGIIRCDTHGFWYAPFFQAPDAVRLRKAAPGIHYYFYQPDNPTALRFPPVPGMEIRRVWDADRAKAQGLADSYPEGQVTACDRFSQVSEKVDLVYIADCSGQGEDHLKFATPGLKRGIPHFVDKPFAYTLRDAHAIIDLAKRNRTAVMCWSLLRVSPFIKRFRLRLDDIAPVGALHIRCGGPSLAGVFHGVSLVQGILGRGCESVESMGPILFDVMRLHYPRAGGGIRTLILNARANMPAWKGKEINGYTHDYHHCRYQAAVYGADGSAYSRRVDDFTFLNSGRIIVRAAKKMAQTRRPPVDYDDMLELIEIIEAARLAHNKGRPVYLDEVRKRRRKRA